VEIIEAKYIKCHNGERYRFIGQMYGNLGGDGAVLYISGGVDEAGSATIDIFEDREQAYNSDPFSPDLPNADGYLDTAYLEQGAWVYEICRNVFVNILAHSEPDDDAGFEACVDFSRLLKYYREECR
jgi:hypothetical protein